MKHLFLVLFILSGQALAQDISRDLEIIESQSPQSMPFNVPLYVDAAGNLSILFNQSVTSMTYRPALEVAWKKSRSLYIKPIASSSFEFIEQKTNLKWIEVKRKRWELGLGLNAIQKSLHMNMGLTPYKGSRFIMTREIDNKDEVTSTPRLPKTLSEIDSWRVNDQGSFQTYGGIQLSVGVGFSPVNILTVGLTIQNLFNVVIKKVDSHKIYLAVSEEDVTKRRMESGATVIRGTFNKFNGKRMTSRFFLDLDNPEHHTLYESAIKGKFAQLQEKLPPDYQKIEWRGKEKIGYIGVPLLAEKYYTRAQYEMNFDKESDVLDIRSRRSSGFLVPFRNHNKLAYQTDTDITLFWYSEMNKTDDDLLTRKFISVGKVLGARGFAQVRPTGMALGSTLAQMGMTFSRNEIVEVNAVILEEIIVNFKNRCLEMNLSCAQSKEFNKVVKTLRSFSHSKWRDIRDTLALLMLDQPALIYAYVKTLKVQKTVFFKFMSQTFQSLEGSAPVEI